jgi:hypothetical protein
MQRLGTLAHSIFVKQSDVTSRKNGGRRACLEAAATACSAVQCENRIICLLFLTFRF